MAGDILTVTVQIFLPIVAYAAAFLVVINVLMVLWERLARFNDSPNSSAERR